MNDRVRKRVEKLIQPPQEVTLYSELEYTIEQYRQYKSEMESPFEDFVKRELAKKMVDHLIKSGIISFYNLEDPIRRTITIRASLKAKQQYATVNEDLII